MAKNQVTLLYKTFLNSRMMFLARSGRGMSKKIRTLINLFIYHYPANLYV